MKKLLLQQRGDTPHWVGDGFPVSSIFRYDQMGKIMTPFLLMDYAGPTHFKPSPNHARGVGEHPHRGFETVTVVYEGEVEHRDSHGGGGLIKADEVQWMTAASGLVHEEFHGKEFSKTGGPFEMVQLWVNLPSQFKMTTPRYQGITKTQIPKVEIGTGGSYARVIAGEFTHKSPGQTNSNTGADLTQTLGPAKTFSPVNLWDLRLAANEEISLNVPEGQTATLFVLGGEIVTEDGQILRAHDLGVFERKGTELKFKTAQASKILFMGGEPINEPIVGWGPFVMNTQSEIAQALQDYQQGKMGNLT